MANEAVRKMMQERAKKLFAERVASQGVVRKEIPLKVEEKKNA